MSEAREDLVNPRVPAEHHVAAMAARPLPPLDAAHNLARWLVRNDHDAEDVVQEAFMRAFRYGPGAGVQDVRPWLLAIVRNTSRACLRKRGGDERLRPIEGDVQSVDPPPDPEQQALQRADARAVGAALADLPPAFREALLLRE